MKTKTSEIIVKGKKITVDVLDFEGKEIVITGSLIRQARLKDEWYVDCGNPKILIEQLQKSNPKIDFFTFWQMLPDIEPRYNYLLEWDNVAAIPVQGYEYWLKNQASKNARQAVSRASRRGVIVRLADFNEELIKGIKSIYDEAPVRQGKPFWHYNKDLEYVKQENDAFLDRSDFIGAYYNDELIGYIKTVYDENVSCMLQIVTKNAHHDKFTTNALLAKAVELCEKRGKSYLIYGKYTYGNKNKGSLVDLKRHNGFQKINLPRYYIPVSLRGEMFLKMNLQNGILGLLPNNFIDFMLNIRRKWYSRFE